MNRHATIRTFWPSALLGVYTLAAGCFTEVRVLDVDAGPAGTGGSGGATGGADPTASGMQQGGSALSPAERERVCTLGGQCLAVDFLSIDKVDLLFVIDNSDSMAEEQRSLRAQFPRLIEILASGDQNLDGASDFPPAKDLHLGVVSTDLGAPGIAGGNEAARCEGLGDDGLLLHATSPLIAGCVDRYPTFLTYTAGVNAPSQTAVDLACIATLGTDGCRFEQPLEAALKALWPVQDPMPLSDGSNRITFLGDIHGLGEQGHGDLENDGFVRNNPLEGLSLIAIVVVTDGEDCSSVDTSHFTPAHLLQPNDPLATQDLNLRCFNNQENLFPLSRYIEGYRALRPGAEQLVFFSVIAGVPPDLVEPEDHERVDFTSAAQRDAFYERILSDPRMIETVDSTRTPEQGGDLVPSCNTARGTAYPPRRLVSVARGFGANGVVQSICQEDLTPAIDLLTRRLGTQLGARCLEQPLARDAQGLVACDVLWQLPPPRQASPQTPVFCGEAQFDFLLPPGRDRPETDEHGGALCKVAQLAVTNIGTANVGARSTRHDEQWFGEGWYYDDFLPETAVECQNDKRQRIRFTPAANPPPGVRVILDCER